MLFSIQAAETVFACLPCVAITLYTDIVHNCATTTQSGCVALQQLLNPESKSDLQELSPVPTC